MHARTLLGTALFALGTASWAPGARAQSSEAPEPRPAHTDAFEFTAGAGYAQGFGNITSGTPILDVAGAGVAVSADFDYRSSPTASIGLETQYQEFATEHDAAARGMAANIGVTLRATPERQTDLWMRFGTGYRMLWVVDPLSAPKTTNVFHGFDLVAAKVGLDVRASANTAIAPVLGADLQTFSWADATPLTTTQVGMFLYLGLQGRFDTGGRSSTVHVAQR